MTEYVNHEGFRIHAAPHQLADSGEWSLNIYIEIDKLSEIVSGHFFTSDSFKSREDAIAHCFNFGKRIIDGQVEGLSVQDLVG
jgi:hypothetical protein